jgi:hypothetical protein
MAKNLERAKQFQRTLWRAAGWQWTEKDFDERWIHKPLGDQWDAWYEQKLAPVSFCALCGDDQLASGRFTPKWSRHNVPINLCDTCYAKRMEALYGSANGVRLGPPNLRSIIATQLGPGGCCLILVLLIGIVVAIVVYLVWFR